MNDFNLTITSYNENPWEQRKLREISSSTIGGGTPKSSNKKFWNGNIPWIQSSDLVNGDIWNITIKKHITLNAVENSAAKIISANSIAVVTRVAVGKLVYMPLEYATSQDFISFQNLSGDHSFFMYLVSKVMHKVRGSLQGTSIKGISKGELLKKKVIYTLNIKEQKKIGTLLKSLDTILTLYERKLKLLSQAKKYFLDNLFAEKEYPNLRFKEFTDAWEQRKLGKQNKITMGQSPSSKNYTDNPKDWILIQGNADLKSGKVAPRIYTSQLTKKADIGDIILTVRAPVGEVAITNYNAVLGRGVAAIKGSFFIYFALEKFKANNKWNIYSSGSTFDSITGKDLNNLPLFFPSETEENKIGGLLNKLNNLLTLYENKKQNLIEIKKSLLNTMFI